MARKQLTELEGLQIRPIDEHSPEYGAGRAKLQELERRASELEGQLADLSERQRIAKHHLDDAATALLEGRETDLQTADPREIDRLQREVEVTRRAIALQKQRLDALRGQISLKLVKEDLWPALRAATLKKAAHVRGLAELEQAEVHLRDQLNAAGYADYLPVTVVTHPPGPIGDQQAYVHSWIKEARETGLIGAKE